MNNNRVRSAFDDVRADKALKAKTMAVVAEAARRVERRSRAKKIRLIPVIACLSLLLIVAGGVKIYNTPTAVISVDINPSVELGINRFDKVVSVTGYNEDGKELANMQGLKNENFETAVRRIIGSDKIRECIARGEMLSLAVVGGNEAQRGRILSGMNDCASGCEGSVCRALDADSVSMAHKNAFSYGKYGAFLELKELDPDIDIDEVRAMTMREIRERISALSGEPNKAEGKYGGGQHQRGYGHREG